MEPEVKLINFTENALEVLIYTKSGRLATGTTFPEVLAMPFSEKMEHWGYMMDTIQTSFEFVDYVFEIKNVSRAFTHQLVRTRTASFQQQAMRVVDARDFTHTTTTDNPLYDIECDSAKDTYGALIDKGVPVQDARGVLPTAIHTQIMMKANLRTLANMSELRLCKRAEGEYQKVFQMMSYEVKKIHPWAAPLLQVYCVKYGICAFPRYDKCPVQAYCFKLDDRGRNTIKTKWLDTDHVANPVANKNGMTM
ncbi:MAG: FAD-dependent thymidylate synthase [bacterium]|nr:FAD-dependent thymidylate synthase [bacterium]